MKILVFGAGVLGSYYAAKLFNAKLDVTILARGEKYKNIKEKGIVLENYLSDEKIIAPVKVINKLDSTDFDLVLIFVQRIHVKNILPELAKIKNAKSFIFFGNNFIGFEKTCNILGKEKVLAGFGAIGGKRKGHTVVFADADRREPEKKGPIIIGELNGLLTDRLLKIKEILHSAGIEVKISKDIDGWLKTHAVVILNLAGAAYKVNLELKKLAENKQLLYLMIQSIKQSIKVLFYAGITIEPFKYRILALLPDFILYRMFKKLLVSEFAAIGLAGHARAARSEMKALSLDFLKLAGRSSVKMDALKKILSYI